MRLGPIDLKDLFAAVAKSERNLGVRLKNGRRFGI